MPYWSPESERAEMIVRKHSLELTPKVEIWALQLSAASL